MVSPVGDEPRPAPNQEIETMTKTMSISVHLTDARIGALQQAGLDPRDPDTFELNHCPDEELIVMAWLAGYDQNRLVFDDAAQANAAAGAIDELSNAEDETAERWGDQDARRASDVLCRLAIRVRTVAQKKSKKLRPEG
jgi:hypothetical protein